MENKEAIAKFRITPNELEISGPVDFVKDQVQFNKNIIDFFAESIKQKILNGKTEDVNRLGLNESKLLTDENPTKRTSEYAEFVEVKDADTFLDKYSDVLAKNGDKLQVLSKIPGNSLGARMVNLILIYLYAKLKISSIEKVSFNDLRNFCQMHSELDAAHFSEYIKKNKKWFLLDGNGQSHSAKITVPGMKEAERLLDSMK